MSGHVAELPDVYCPFTGDLRCMASPPCPTLRDRACVNGEDE